MRDASDRELGLQAVELVGEGLDDDFDRAVDEFGIAVTALTIYLAAQPRPATRLALSELGLTEPLGLGKIAHSEYGEALLADTGCVAELDHRQPHLSPASTLATATRPFPPVRYPKRWARAAYLLRLDPRPA